MNCTSDWLAVERWGGPIRWAVDGGVWFYRLLTLIVLVRLVAWEFGIHWGGDVPTLYITAIVVMSNQARARSGHAGASDDTRRGAGQ